MARQAADVNDIIPNITNYMERKRPTFLDSAVVLIRHICYRRLEDAEDVGGDQGEDRDQGQDWEVPGSRSERALRSLGVDGGTELPAQPPASYKSRLSAVNNCHARPPTSTAAAGRRHGDRRLRRRLGTPRLGHRAACPRWATPSVDVRRVGVAHRIHEGDGVALDETTKGVTR